MILSIILKNLKIILRSPFTILILILAPMILMFLIGLAYNNGDQLTNTKIGIFGEDPEFFTSNKVTFINYNADSLEESNRQCQDDLKLNKLELCIYLQTQKQEGEVVSAKVTYIMDNTKTTISNILINHLEYEIRSKTKEISSNTITDILSEVDSTLEFINETRILVKDIDESVTELDREVNQNDNEIRSTISALKILVPSLLNSARSLEEELDSLEELQSDSADSISDELSEASGSLEEIQELLEELEEDVENEIGFVPASVSSYVNEIDNNINSINNIVEGTQDDVFTIQRNINEVDTESMKRSLTSLISNLEQIEPEIENIDKNYNLLKNILSDAKNQVGDVNTQLDEKYTYFNELSNQDSSQIVNPISSETHRVFKEFTRIHELAPTIIIVVILFIGLLLSNVIVSMEVQSKAYFRNLISPVSQASFLTALFLTSLVIILFQLFFFFIILQYVFYIPSFFSFVDGVMIVVFWDVLIIAIHALMVFILLGMFLSLLFNSMQVSILMTTFTMLFLFLLSDIIIPLQLMPEFFYNAISYNPVVIAQDLFREIFFFYKLYSFDVTRFMPFYVYSGILILCISLAQERKKSQLL